MAFGASRTECRFSSTRVLSNEEALAESFAQVAVHGLRGLLAGIAFPVRHGYVTLLLKHVTHHGNLMPIVPEAVGLYLGGVNVNSWLGGAHFSPQSPD